MSSKNGSSSADSSGREENEEGNSNIALQTSRAQQLSFQDERSLQQIETESQARNYPFVHYFQQHETQQARLSAGKTDSTTSTDNDDPAYAHRPSFAGEGIFMATSADLIDQSQSSVKGKRGASSVPQSSCVEAGDSVRSSYRAPAQPNTNSGAPEGISSVKFEPNYREGNGNRDILGNLYHPESGFKEAQTSAHLNPAQWVGDSR